MAQSGLHVPATRASLPMFAQVLADIGDQQSIAANLSTFTAHMRNIAEMAERVSPPALILLDEVGTEPTPTKARRSALQSWTSFTAPEPRPSRRRITTPETWHRKLKEC